VIAIVSPASQERTALAALCVSRGWTTTECDSLRAFQKLLQLLGPGIVLTRRRLGDGYADDVMAALAAAGMSASAHVVVLIGAGTTPSVEARLVALGADCVQRDPVRPDVLVEYLAKYQAVSPRTRQATPPIVLRPFSFAGAVVDPVERTLQRGKRASHLTPHEVELIELLLHSEGGILTYDTLYSDILDRRFRGDTSNMRVLLGKLMASAELVGLSLRDWVQVIPKLGYRYRQPAAPVPPVAKLRRARTAHSK
jgi:DNA-binding response OmpR family regulator